MTGIIRMHQPSKQDSTTTVIARIQIFFQVNKTTMEMAYHATFFCVLMLPPVPTLSTQIQMSMRILMKTDTGKKLNIARSYSELENSDLFSC